MKGILGFHHNGKLIIKETISNSERIELIKSLEYLENLEVNIFLPASIIWYNIVEIINLNSWLKENATKEISFINLNDGVIKIEISRRICNFLSSFRSFLDVTSSYLSENNQTDLKDEFKKCTNNLFDSNFNYRFLYKLRNYSQHFSFPIANIYFDNTDKDKIQFELTIERDKLLKYDSWGKVKSDLLAQKAEIPILTHINDFYQHIQTLQNILIKNKISEIRELSKPAFLAYTKTKDMGNAPILGWPKLDSNGNHNLQLETKKIPTSFLDIISKI
ncbi:hypothetical protein NUH30_19085 [Leptospira sp. 85282-16]|uniref:hypothetical protein n=1 Tax=Leptospira sp. 85282-16 TaxID=2971256 RepID=UPI0021C1279F|nr:hypothetical protein [Leptospira sp. 85282-16]MCT8335799.1 hypothetical protein [Leptospira sp. 85282-16]